MLAMERGEVNGVVGVSWSTLKATSADWLAQNKIRVFVQFGLSRHPELPTVPWVFDSARTDDDRAAMNMMFATQEFGRPYVAPPGLPEPVIGMLRSGFEAMMNDPEFHAEAERRKLDLDITRGSDIQSIVEKIYRTPPAVVARVKAVLGDQLPQ
jgi:tripartite-type tricarboxylate transporter receptor subunit TctC